MSRRCKDLIAKGENDQTHGGGLLNKRIAFLIRYKQLYVSLILGKKISKEENLKFTPYMIRDFDILVDQDTRLRNIGIPLDGTILNTPGHTVDFISILFDDYDCLVGDAAADMLSFAGTHNCVIFVCDLGEYYKSWEKIIQAGAKKSFQRMANHFQSKSSKPILEKTKRKIWSRIPEWWFVFEKYDFLYST